MVRFLPQMDGFMVSKVLKRNPETKHIPIIFVSSLNTKEDLLNAIKSGGIDYIVKPFEASDLLEGRESPKGFRGRGRFLTRRPGGGHVRDRAAHRFGAEHLQASLDAYCFRHSGRFCAGPGLGLGLLHGCVSEFEIQLGF